MFQKSLQILLLFSLLFFQGCGYSLNHRLKDTFNASGKGIFVPVFDNNTNEVGAEIFFTNALIRELESHGEHTVSSREGAGLEFFGTILRVFHNVEVKQVGTKGLRAINVPEAKLHSYASIPDQIGVRVDINLKLYDAATRQLKWEKEFSHYRRVSAPLDRVSDRDAPSSLPLITQSLIDTTYPDIARDAMRDVYDQMVDVY